VFNNGGFRIFRSLEEKVKKLVFINLTDSSTNKIKTYFPQSCEFLKVDLEDIPNLCDKFKIKKNLINPLYIS